MNNFKLDFLGIGTIKSGSSLMANLLMQHPQVQWASRKEVNYFNKLQANGSPNPFCEQPLSFYRQFFPDRLHDNKKQGEFSPVYIIDEKAMHKIQSLFPDIKLIVTLRNPAHRAYSHFLYARDFLQEIPTDMTFEKALHKYPYLKTIGCYSMHLERMFSLFPTKQCRVIIFEELIQDPVATAQKIYQFIGVDSKYTPVVTKVNPHKKIRNQWVENMVNTISRLKPKSGSALLPKFYNSPLYPILLNWKHQIRDANIIQDNKPVMSTATYQRLIREYEKDILKTEDLLKRKISQWR